MPRVFDRYGILKVGGSGSATVHGSLLGLSADDHPQYILANGSRPFSSPVGGVDPVSGSDLATKDFVLFSLSVIEVIDGGSA